MWHDELPSSTAKPRPPGVVHGVPSRHRTSLLALVVAVAPMTTRAEMTAGTAGDGYLAARRLHPWNPCSPDPGERIRCLDCGSTEKSLHIPAPRKATK